MERESAAKVMAALGALASGSEAFVASSRARGVSGPPTVPSTGAAPAPRPHGAGRVSGAPVGLAAIGGIGGIWSRRARKPLKKRLVSAALPESADFLHHVAQMWNHGGQAEFVQQAQQLWQHAAQHAGDQSMPHAADVAAAWQQWADALSEGAGRVAHDLVPPAYAAEVELDPNATYLYGADGAVLVDPMNNKPITDDWWNGFIGFQSELIKSIDNKLREVGVEQAFGWTIVLYTAFIKLVFFPLQQGQLKSTSMMQLLSPKVKEIQEKYKDDPDTQQRLLGQLYSVMDVNPLGGCLPVLLQLPIFWSLYGVWRRLAAEKFPHYTEGWLWVPSLAQPNPDFQFKYDWLLQFQDGQPAMGWHDYLCYLVFPALLVGFTVFQQQQAQTGRPKTSEDDPQNVVLQVLPWISVYFIGSLSLQLPQAVSVYYSMNSALSLLQTQVVKLGLRQEIVGYEEFERTGKFPDGAFEDMVRQSTPAPKNLHEAALRGEVSFINEMLDEEAKIDKWDEKKIAPLGYAVACGHLEAVKLLLARGADVTLKDGQDNTVLHYASGYGHMEVLKELIQACEEKWPDQSWKDFRNSKGQTVVDAARANRKGQVVDYLCELLGIDVQTVKLPPAPGGPGGESSDADRARAALLAAAGAADKAAPAGAGQAPASPPDTSAMRAAVEKLRSNPEALEQAKKMMGKIPPQMLQMLSGNKISTEQAKKAMDAMADMSTEDLLERADSVMNKETVPPASLPPPSSNKPARSVD
ncbi:unnamed protein product [Effrenium voratum]|nr:unnamed protein product [Effrenium voratum]